MASVIEHKAETHKVINIASQSVSTAVLSMGYFPQ
jgi:hypothetical protein